MQTSPRRSKLASAAASVLAAGTLAAALAGCENPTDRADKDLQKQVADVQPKSLKVEDRREQIDRLAAAAKLPNTSEVARADVLMRQAQAEIAAGDRLMGQVGLREIGAARLLGQVRGLTAQIEANNNQMDVLRGQEPKASRDYLGTRKTAITAGENGVWINEGGAEIPAQSAVNEAVTKLTEEISRIDADRARLDGERRAATAEADKLAEEARKLRGQPKLDVGIREAGLRKTALDKGRQIELLDLAKAKAGQDLAVAKARQGELQKGVEALDARSGKYDADWKAVEDQIAQVKAASDKVLGKPGATPATLPSLDPAPAPAGGETAGGETAAAAATPAAEGATEPGTAGTGGAAPARPAAGAAGGGAAGGAAPPPKTFTMEDIAAKAAEGTITRKAEEVALLLADANDKRAQALQFYDAALTHTKEASALATKVVTDVSKRIADPKYAGVPEREAWIGLVDVLSDPQFKTQQATIHEKVARAHADLAATLKVRADVYEVLERELKEAELTATEPAAALGQARVGGEPKPVAGARDDAAKAAEENYATAEGLLKEVAEAKGPSQYKAPSFKTAADAARAALIPVQYAHGQFLIRMGEGQKGRDLARAALDMLKNLDPAKDRLPGHLTPEMAIAIGLGPMSPRTQAAGTPGAGTPGAGPTADPTGPATPDTPEQAAVRAAAQAFANATLVQRDAAAATALGNGDPGVAEQVGALVQFLGPLYTLRDALQAKFGEALGRDFFVGFIDGMGINYVTAADRGQVTINGETATVVSGKSELTFQQVGGQWRFQPYPAERRAVIADGLRKVEPVLTQAAADVAAGKYATMEEFGPAAVNAVAAAVGAPAPTLPATTPPGGESPAAPPAPPAGDTTTPPPPPAETPAPPPPAS